MNIMVSQWLGTILAAAGDDAGESGFGKFWQYEVYGNEIWRFGLLLGVILGTLIAGRIVRFFIERSAARMDRYENMTLMRLFLRCLARPAAIGLFAAGMYLSRMTVQFALKVGEAGFAEETYELWGKISQAVMALAVAYFMFRLVDLVEHYLKIWTGRTETTLDDMLVPVIRKSLRIFIGVVSALFIGDNILDLKLSSIIAAAGVGGLAFALAAKDTISNFFGSINIFADRPFQVGDRIKVGDFDGPVEEVGFRSTRIRTLTGHLVTIPNSTIANEMVENIGRRPYIRRLANITITYDTPVEKVAKAVEIIKDVLAGTEEVNRDQDLPPRVFFNEFNDWALNILVLYWVKPPDYWMFQEVNQRVNLAIMRRFEAEGIEFAFPSQTVYLQQGSSAGGED